MRQRGRYVQLLLSLGIWVATVPSAGWGKYTGRAVELPFISQFATSSYFDRVEAGLSSPSSSRHSRASTLLSRLAVFLADENSHYHSIECAVNHRVRRLAGAEPSSAQFESSCGSLATNRLATTQIELINVITDLCATIQSTEHDDWTRGRVQARQELLQGYWEDFMSNHLELMEPDNDDPSYDRASNYALVQGQYVDATGVLYDVQSRLQSEPRRPERVMAHLEAPASAQSHSRLPQINVPDFSGRREDWESFRDLFNALIHQSSHLSNVERLYYLKTLVRGDARSALDSLQLTGDNYDTAWKLLESRYENRRLLVHEHLLALRSLKPLREPSAKAFQQLIDTLSRHRDQLRTLKCPVDTWDAWFISIAASCMDPITRQAWEADLERNDAENGVDRAARKGDHLASFDDLSTFLNSRCRMAVACSSGAVTTTRQSTSSSDHRPARAYATRQGRQDCVRCGSEHYVGHCDAFASMNSAERRELVMQQRLCFNCLRPGHAVRACPSRSTCQTCGATHHTLLHEGSRKRAASSHEPGPPAKTRSTSLATLENAAPGARGTDDEQSAEPS
ncbi:unnamed protein product [Trichogramma brassicae]|uniref:CCHC-type domain-containing protein n=1 Tax=Trichogramma brassicae TaxID=86971 RepID=A0A6H5J1P4_9HYME|nr:unnamed protein product [Trichogramma brassicae]